MAHFPDGIPKIGAEQPQIQIIVTPASGPLVKCATMEMSTALFESLIERTAQRVVQILDERLARHNGDTQH
jgi:hypothetical protein